MKRLKFTDPSQRRKSNVAYLGALILPDIARDVKKLYPGLDVGPLECLDEEFYAPIRLYLNQVLDQLERDQ